MHAAIAFIVGIIVGLIILAVIGRQQPVGPTAKPAVLGWLTFAFGLIGAVAFIGMLGWIPGAGLGELASPMLSIGCSFTTIVIGIGALVKGDRHWPTVVGFIAGLAPAFFWILFALGTIFNFGG